ncbi:E2F-associated phosphoprotein [Babesia duncani]|uniref:E2F-associated phosphoprotein n=1 Tax=Babesia duncani TaxID=323732 RepID=A0AAD9UPB8_9APIC|nr:E2F-associated phosphoprotein [Babesia duncani]
MNYPIKQAPPTFNKIFTEAITIAKFPKMLSPEAKRYNIGVTIYPDENFKCIASDCDSSDLKTDTKIVDTFRETGNRNKTQCPNYNFFHQTKPIEQISDHSGVHHYDSSCTKDTGGRMKIDSINKDEEIESIDKNALVVDSLEDFYDSELDEQDDAFVNENFRIGDLETDAVLSCAGCFAPICYQCKRNPGGYFESRLVINTVKLPTISRNKDCLGIFVEKRKLVHGPTKRTNEVLCSFCNNTVATLNREGVYKFKNVLAS